MTDHPQPATTARLLALGDRPGHSYLGIAWTALAVATMFALARAKRSPAPRSPTRSDRPKSKVTAVDGILAGLAPNAAPGWWWTDPAPACVLVVYGASEAHHTLTS